MSRLHKVSKKIWRSAI